MHKTAAILLAAGLSSRMGQIKALLPWKGRTMIQYQIEQMIQAEINEIVVVLGFQADQLQNNISSFEVKTVINKDYKRGKASSILKGMSSLPDGLNGIFISAVDQPVPSDVLKKMVKRLEETEAAAVIPTYGNKRGHPILFNGSLRNELLLIQEETLGLRSVIQKFQQQITFLDVSDPSVLFNFNNPEEYFDKRLEAQNESIGN